MAHTETRNGRQVTSYRRADLDNEAKRVVTSYRKAQKLPLTTVKLDFWQLEVSGGQTARLAVQVTTVTYGVGCETNTLYHVL